MEKLDQTGRNHLQVINAIKDLYTAYKEEV